MLRPLDLKLLRDLGAMKGQMAAVAVVMACGLMVMIMERGLVVSLESSRDAYYRDHRLADLFGDLKRAPNSLGARLAQISDVAVVETRVKGATVLNLPGMQEPAEGVILSIPDRHPQRLNLLYLRSGRLPLSGNRGEVVVSDAFAQAHAFRPGDTIDATIYGARIALSERAHDLATLRVLGFTQHEVAAVLIGELALLTLLALLPGLFIGSQLTHVILASVSTETLRIPVVLTGRAYATAVLIVLLSSGLSFAVVSRRIATLDLLGVMKARQ